MQLMIKKTNSDDLVTALAAQGYAIINQALPIDLITQLRREALSLQKTGLMQRAKTGKNPKASSTNELRGDFTYWLEVTDNKKTNVTTPYIEHMEAVKVLLNQTLFLGLFDFETHFAIYPAGSGYSKHLDQFQQNKSQLNASGQRKVSTILYLNENWQSQDGGQLRLYLDNNLESNHYLDIEPTAGRLVIFLSEYFWHEVLPAQRDRISLTGWFRTR